MLHNKSLKIFFIVSYYQDFLSFQVVVDIRFFWTKSCSFVTKIGVERVRVLNFVTSSSIYLYWQWLYILIFNLPVSYFAWARDGVSIPSKLVRSRRSNCSWHCNHQRHRTLQCYPLRRLLVVNNNVFPDFSI